MKRLYLIALTACLVPGASLAEDWMPVLRTGMEFQGETDLKDLNSGEFNFWLWNLGGDVSGEVADDVRLGFDADYTVIGYDFDDIATGEPWETVHVVRLTPTFEISVTDEWSIVTGPFIEFSGEDDADFGDTISGGGLFGVGYRMSDDLSLGLGLVVRSEIEDDVYVQPWVRASWDATDDLNVSLGTGSRRGGQLRVGYTFLDDFEAAFSGGFRRERFRLDDSGPTRDGVGQEEAIVGSLNLVWNFFENASAEVYVGLTADGEFRLENSRGHKIIDSDYDDAAMGGFRFRYDFGRTN
ncbi:MAG: hypothetical protein ACQGVC_12045 [Myxococcota bacterium]